MLVHRCHVFMPGHLAHSHIQKLELPPKLIIKQNLITPQHSIRAVCSVAKLIIVARRKDGALKLMALCDMEVLTNTPMCKLIVTRWICSRFIVIRAHKLALSILSEVNVLCLYATVTSDVCIYFRQHFSALETFNQLLNLCHVFLSGSASQC